MSGPFVYSVAIKLTVANLASQGIRMLGADLLAAHTKAVSLQDKLQALKLTAIGFGMERAGAGMLGFMHKAVDASKEYTHQLSLMNAAGFTHAELADSIASAWSTTHRVMNTTAAENLATIRELRSAFGAGEGMQHAYAVMPQVARASAIMQSLTGKEQANVGFDMVKAIEFATKGALSIPALMKQSEMMTKALVAFGGTLTVSDFHQTFKAAKSAAPFLTDDFKYTVLPTIMQEMKSGHGGAQAAGTALATLFGTVKGHAIQTRMIPAWMAAGLIAPGGVVADKHHKGMSRIGPGGIRGENLFSQDPFQWAQQFLVPARDKLMRTRHLDEIGAYYSLTGNRNSAFMFQTLANKGVQIARDQNLIARVGSSYSAYQSLLKSDPQLAEQAMHAQWQNILSILGYQVLPAVIPYMQKFASALNSIASVFANHPILARTFAYGTVATGAGLVVGGKALMTFGLMKYLGLNPISLAQSLGAGALSYMATGLSLLGTAFRTLSVALFTNPIGLTILGVAAAAFVLYKNWKTVGPYLAEVWSIIRAVFKVSAGYIVHKAQEMWAIVGPVVTKAWSILQATGSYVGSAFASIYSAVTGWLGKLVGWIANSWIGKAIGFAVGKLGGTVAHDFDQAYKWSQGVNGEGGSPYIRSGQPAHIHTHTKISLDGRVVAHGVTHHIVKALQGPNQGPSSFLNSSHGVLRPQTA